MNRYKKLASNTGIFFIANFGSKILSFLLVRFYTGVLTTSEYGTIDIITSTMGVVVPLITMCITEAVLRFSIDDENSRGKIFSIGISVVIAGNLIFLLSFPLFLNIPSYRNNIILFYALLLTNSFYQMISHFSRGMGKTKVFAISGVLHTFLQIGLNILFLLFFKLGVWGYLGSSIMANVVCIIYIVKLTRIYENVALKLDKVYMKAMLKYSIPLIPNSIFWWIMASSDRYVILYFYSESVNGLYSVANKIPNMITSISSIFFYAWQLSSVDEAQSKSKGEFYSKVLQFVTTGLLIVISFIMVIVQPLYSIWVDKSYYEGWSCVPLLTLAVFFSCLSNYVGTNYIAMKKTNGVFLTTVMGAVVNIALNILLTPLWGMKGTAFATVVAFALTWIIRTFDTRKFALIHYDFRTFIVPLIIIFIQVTLLSFNVISIIPQVLLFIVVIIFCSKYIFALCKKLILKIMLSKQNR